MTNRILLVDDDPNILSAFRRQLRKEFDIEVAEGGEQALEVVCQRGPFAVVVSDMKMPRVSGVEFLARLAQQDADTVRIMLTGNADQATAVAAVNDGRVFRFLRKPCPPEELAKALRAGLEQYRLVAAERELLTKTLSGSVRLLTEVVSLVNPTAFGRTSRVRRLARQICERLGIENAWEIEMAAMLSQVGCVTVPEHVLARYYAGEDLTPDEAALVRAHPRVGHDLVAKIPRLENVARIIAQQNDPFNGSSAASTAEEEHVRLGAQILKATLDFDTLSAAANPIDALQTMRFHDRHTYSPRVIDALAWAVDARFETRHISVDEVKAGMIIDDHILAYNGERLLARGFEVTEPVLALLRNFASSRGVREPIRVRSPASVQQPHPGDRTRRDP